MKTSSLRVASAIPVLLFTIALFTASFAVAQYLDATEQTDIRQTDTLYLTRLDLNQQGQYREYRHHRVYPDPAARWVGEERELRNFSSGSSSTTSWLRLLYLGRAQARRRDQSKIGFIR